MNYKWQRKDFKDFIPYERCHSPFGPWSIGTRYIDWKWINVASLWDVTFWYQAASILMESSWTRHDANSIYEQGFSRLLQHQQHNLRSFHSANSTDHRAVISILLFPFPSIRRNSLIIYKTKPANRNCTNIQEQSYFAAIMSAELNPLDLVGERNKVSCSNILFEQSRWPL